MAQTNHNRENSQKYDLVFTKITDSISVTVKPVPLLDDSDPAQKIFNFSYTISIKNLSTETVQLLERHWIINSGSKFFDEVIGDGVVGMQPHIEEGQSFEYTSAACIEDAYGSMKGSYTMRSASGKFFKVEIPEFDLIHPDFAH